MNLKIAVWADVPECFAIPILTVDTIEAATRLTFCGAVLPTDSRWTAGAR